MGRNGRPNTYMFIFSYMVLNFISRVGSWPSHFYPNSKITSCCRTLDLPPRRLDIQAVLLAVGKGRGWRTLVFHLSDGTGGCRWTCHGLPTWPLTQQNLRTSANSPLILLQQLYTCYHDSFWVKRGHWFYSHSKKSCLSYEVKDM